MGYNDASCTSGTMIMTEKIKDMQSLANLLDLSSAEEAELAHRIALLLQNANIDLPELLKQSMATRNKTARNPARSRVSGRLKGKLVVGPEFFEPLSAAVVRELNGE